MPVKHCPPGMGHHHREASGGQEHGYANAIEMQCFLEKADQDI